MADRKDITVQAVLAEAKRLRERAEAIRRNDCWAKPYSPSDATARKMSQQLGPAPAIETMRLHAANVDNEYREQCARAERAQRKHKRHLEIVESVRREKLLDLTVGQRMDRALRGLGTSTAGPTMKLDGDRVKGGDEKSREPRDPRDRKNRDDGEFFRERALTLVKQAEDALERATPADLWPGDHKPAA